MQEICTYGSVRGVPGNRHSYRDKGLRRAEMKRGGWFGEASAGVTEGEHCGKREALKER